MRKFKKILSLTNSIQDSFFIRLSGQGCQDSGNGIPGLNQHSDYWVFKVIYTALRGGNPDEAISFFPEVLKYSFKNAGGFSISTWLFQLGNDRFAEVFTDVSGFGLESSSVAMEEKTLEEKIIEEKIEEMITNSIKFVQDRSMELFLKQDIVGSMIDECVRGLSIKEREIIHTMRDDLIELMLCHYGAKYVAFKETLFREKYPSPEHKSVISIVEGRVFKLCMSVIPK